MKRKTETYDLVVCGGGLAGFSAAVAAARHGAKTCLIQDRPVFGGNSSSEVRVTPHGAAQYHTYARETGIISELLIEERARNHEQIIENGWTNSVWDLTLYDMAVSTPNLTFHVNTTILRVEKSDARTIRSVTGLVAAAETEITFLAPTFVDCTGDGVVADLAGCEWRMGSEGKDEFGEPHAPEKASKDTMGNSIHFKARDMGRPVPFQAPDWAVKHEDPSYFYDQGRVPYDVRGGFWWIEIGVPWDTIHDAEDIRHELTRHCLGIWDWIKNKDPRTKEKAANFALDWIGQVPGKRESRRVMGRYLMTEHDPVNKTVFPDEIAYGGWFIDLHTPGGLLAPTSEPASAEHYAETSEYAAKSYAGPYGIPLRILIAKDVDNLFLAGRNVSVTHAALGTVRVMATTALMGQAVGTAAALALPGGLPIAEIPEKLIGDVQQTLLRDGCFLPNVRNEDPRDLARTARATASSEALVHGRGPESRDSTNDLLLWYESANGPWPAEPLKQRRGQWIAIGEPRLDAVSVCLSNSTEKIQKVEAKIYLVDHVWDYRVEAGEPLASTTLEVSPGGQQWIEWPVKLTAEQGLAAGRFVRIDLLANRDVEWHSAGGVEPGHMAACQMSAAKMRRYGTGKTQSFRVSPPQPAYGAGNVLTGVTRPHRFTNVWRSNPSEPMSQWLQLDWDSPQTIAQVELTFAGHLFKEYHAYPPLYRDPQCVRDYAIEAWVDGAWREVNRTTGNYQRLRRHVLASAVTTDKLRVVVHATNGDPSAAIYEVRCYAVG